VHNVDPQVQPAFGATKYTVEVQDVDRRDARAFGATKYSVEVQNVDGGRPETYRSTSCTRRPALPRRFG
jgi:hypothetical protein